MYARLLALCCLLYVSVSSGRSLTAAGKDVVVYLKPGGVSGVTLAETQTELVSLMRGLGVRIEWWDAEKSRTGAAGADLIVADFLGTCSAAPGGHRIKAPKSLPPLATTSVADGVILPFAHVDCGALNQFIGALIADQPGARRERIYGRAVARLLAHEIYHIVSHTKDHAPGGIAKESFSAADLLKDRFRFELDSEPIASFEAPLTAANGAARSGE